MKGYLSIYTVTDNFTRYYRLSDNGIRYVVNNRLVKLSDA
jgi:hypothetical protein